jgi:tRNA nucleotidyltransferase (CCA-adding enzyme)
MSHLNLVDTSKIYVVGGSVRDVLLGLPPKDIDYVVVGATPQEMLDVGMKQVGADFPVFLNAAGEEFALARTERKTAAGYHGFEVNSDPTVTLEADLMRRDLTINAMAVRYDDWVAFCQTRNREMVIDPYFGLNDLRVGVLRHVSEAFAEDPLRVLRVARFRARYNFSIARVTVELMDKLVDAGELNALTPERVWVEFEKGLMGEFPYLFIEALDLVCAIEVLLPEYNEFGSISPCYALRDCGVLQLDLMSRFVALFQMVPSDRLDGMFDRLKAPNDVRNFVKKVRIVEDFLNEPRTPDAIAAVLEKLGVYKKSTDLLEIVRMYKLFLSRNPVDQAKVMNLLEMAALTSKITFASLPTELQVTLKGRAITEEINKRRLHAIREDYEQ